LDGRTGKAGTASNRHRKRRLGRLTKAADYADAAAGSDGGSEFGLVLARRTSAVTTPSKTSWSREYSGLKSTAA
jgi:hypothetical protein